MEAIIRVLVLLLSPRLVKFIWLGVVLRLAELLLDVSDHPLLRPVVVVGLNDGVDLREVIVWVDQWQRLWLRLPFVTGFRLSLVACVETLLSKERALWLPALVSGLARLVQQFGLEVRIDEDFSFRIDVVFVVCAELVCCRGLDMLKR